MLAGLLVYLIGGTVLINLLAYHAQRGKRQAEAVRVAARAEKQAAKQEAARKAREAQAATRAALKVSRKRKPYKEGI